MKVADYLEAGCEVQILLADLHAFLDANKSELNKLDARTEYYKQMISAIMTEVLNVDITNLKFVKGTDFQLSPEYTMDVYKFHSKVGLNDAKHAGAEVVKQSSNPPLTSLIYPGLQALDEEYLGVDGEVSGLDQRKIFVYAKNVMPKLGYKKRFYFMNQMMGGLRKVKRDGETIAKMSASDPDSKIDLLDGKNAIRKKINRAYCYPLDSDDNTPMELLEKIIFPLLHRRGEPFIINRKEEHGGSLRFDNFESVRQKFVTSNGQFEDGIEQSELHPGDLKLGVSENLARILEPLRNYFNTKDMRKLLKLAY
jgi:tyrosyl-tRNA synthetase